MRTESSETQQAHGEAEDLTLQPLGTDGVPVGPRGRSQLLKRTLS